MYTLGIETSCDETGVAVVNKGKVLSNVVSSSVHLHSKYGGVVPEIASRYHLEYINSAIKDALKKADITLKDLELIAVTKSPGLTGSLLVGISIAKALSFALSIPLKEVNHITAHLYANFMCHEGLKFPLGGLVVSGGHTSIVSMKGIDKYEVVGQTQDDAAGEAFDKAAKILNLGYPGGPIIEKRAMHGNSERIKFPRSVLRRGKYDFSFSGIKTAVLYYVRKLENIDQQQIDDICASFQEAVCDMITEKTIAYLRAKRLKTLIMGGGVVANLHLRETLKREAEKHGIRVYYPPMKLCLDNGAMVAALAECKASF